MAKTHDKEKQLTNEIAPRVEENVPGVEVLAVELANPDRFVVYVDHPAGVDHDLCARVTDVLRDYLREYTVEVSSPGSERPLRTQRHFAGVACLSRRAVHRCVSAATVLNDRLSLFVVRFSPEQLASDCSGKPTAKAKSDLWID